MSKTPLTPVELATLDRLVREADEGTCYGLLGLDLRASTEDVETAYRDFVRDWHPDRFYSRDPGPRMADIDNTFVEVTRAYKTLRDPKKRSAYDADLSSRGISVAQVAGVARDERVGFEVRLERGTPAARASVTPLAAPVAPSTIQMAARPGAAPPAPAAPAPLKPPSVLALDRARAQMAEQLQRADEYYKAGLTDFEEGRYAKAESALYLAMRYDPRNATYADLFKRAQAKARAGRSSNFTALARQAEQFGNVKDAMAQYRRALECEPEDGVAAFRLALLIRQHEEDKREAVNLLRKAVQKEPRQADYRVALAELYLELKLEQNALREAQAATEADPAHTKARALYKQLRATAR